MYSYGSGSFGGAPQLSFHERMMAASKNEVRSRSRSPDRSSGWVDNSGSSDAGPTKRPSFHDVIMEQARLSKQEAAAGITEAQNQPEKSHSTPEVNNSARQESGSPLCI